MDCCVELFLPTSNPSGPPVHVVAGSLLRLLFLALPVNKHQISLVFCLSCLVYKKSGQLTMKEINNLPLKKKKNDTVRSSIHFFFILILCVNVRSGPLTSDRYEYPFHWNTVG